MGSNEGQNRHHREHAPQHGSAEERGRKQHFSSKNVLVLSELKRDARYHLRNHRRKCEEEERQSDREEKGKKRERGKKVDVYAVPRKARGGHEVRESGGFAIAKHRSPVPRAPLTDRLVAHAPHPPPPSHPSPHTPKCTSLAPAFASPNPGERI